MPIDEKTVSPEQSASLGRAAGPDAVWAHNPSLADEIASVLSRDSLAPDELESHISKLHQQFGDAVYVELLYILAHLDFTPEEAAQHWRRIIDLREGMQEKLATPLDTRVALVAYFVGVFRRLHSPKIIELQLFRETQAFAYRDGLTGLFNFRYFREHLAREVERAMRYETCLTLVMIDIDDFKTYNDTGGHLGGNHLLCAIANVVRESIRDSDTAVRYGGDEFALLLPCTPKHSALTVANRIRQNIAGIDVQEGAEQPLGHVSASIGLASCPTDATNPDALLRCADRAMYVAKSRGKNRVFISGDDRRTYPRIPATVEGTYCMLETDQYSFTTVDVSEGGFLFSVDRQLELGTLLELRVNLPAHGELTCTGRVVHVQEHGPNAYRAGIRLVDLGRDEKILLGQFVNGLAGPGLPSTE